MVDDARAFVDAGCFSILCEVTSEEVCQYLTESLPVPVVSLGAGNKADGVHIITSDLFKLWEEHLPRHSKVYTDLIPIMEDVFIRYRDEVRAHIYPGPEHTVYMADDELDKFAKDMKWDSKLEELEKKRSGKGWAKVRQRLEGSAAARPRGRDTVPGFRPHTGQNAISVVSEVIRGASCAMTPPVSFELHDGTRSGLHPSRTALVQDYDHAGECPAVQRPRASVLQIRFDQLGAWMIVQVAHIF